MNVRARAGVRFAGLLLAMTLAQLTFVPAASAVDDFSLKYPFTDTIMPDGLTVFTVSNTNNWLAGLRGGYLELTDDQPYRQAVLVIDTLPKRQVIDRLRTSFEVLITKAPWSTLPADGFSINFGPDLVATMVDGENGTTNGLSVTFDTYDNGTNDTGPAIEVLYNGKVYGGVAFHDINGTNDQTTWPTQPIQLITASGGGNGTYTLTTKGAQGGKASNSSHNGGQGAEVSGSVHLNDGDILKIAVGGQGKAGQGNGNDVSGGGGGGGSSIVLNNEKLLLMAGGGGGGASDGGGGGGQTSNNGQAGLTGGTSGGAGGTGGGGGNLGPNTRGGAGGAGYYADGGTHYDNNNLMSRGGQAYQNGNNGGVSSEIGGDGGFGGGGEGGPAGSSTDGGGGGGGGYSGGGGGGTKAGGGGGGSYHDASVTNVTSSAGIHPGDGVVTVQRPDGQTLTFSTVGFDSYTVPVTGTNFYPVVVEVGPDPDGKGYVVSVWWNGTRVLNNVVLPADYNPPANWNMAIAAKTGGSAETHHFKNLVLSGDTRVPVTVITPIGHESPDYYPPAGVSWFSSGESVDIVAPRVLWLDQFKRLLPEDQNSRAFYKALCNGADVNGIANPNTSFTLSPDDKTIIKWQYSIYSLGEVNTGTESVPDLSPTDITDPAYTYTLGRRFLEDGDESFDSVVFSSINNSPGDAKSARFNANGYVMENAPGSPERFLQLAGDGDYLRALASLTNHPVVSPAGSFTIDFWARVNPSESAVDQTVFGYGALQVGFGADRGIFMSAGGFTSGAPGGWTDDTWHHWAIVNDRARDAVLIYRDATLIVSNSSSLSSFTGGEYPRAMTVGAYESAGVPGDFFSGGINNLRFWNAALERTNIAASLTTIQYGTTQTNTLQLEMAFDSPPVLPLIGGVYVEQVDATNLVAAGLGLGDTVLTNLTMNNFALPSTGVVPSPGRPVYWRLQSRWSGLPNEPEVAFDVQSDSDTLVFLDYQLVAEVEGSIQVIKNNLKITSGDHMLTILKADASTNRTLSLNIAGYNPSYSLRGGSNLFVNARGVLDLGVVTNTSTEGRQFGFSFLGAGNLLPIYETGTNIAPAVMPGFQLGLAEPGASSQVIASNGHEPMFDWRRVFWGWNKQYSYKVSVTSTDNDGLDAARYLPFFRTELTTIDGVGSISSGTLGQGVVDVLELWLNEGELLTVGSIYRTSDRKFTLSGISGQQAMFGEIDLADLVDGTYSNSFDAGSTREYTFPAVNGPGTLVFQYERTIHRAVLPLGHGLDVSTLAAVNAQLTPPLPVGATNLQITLGGPAVSDETPQTGGVQGGDGTGWAWDYFSRKWYPTKPGVFSITWADQNDYNNTIEVTSGFPTESETRSGFNAWEAPDGSRLGIAPDYTYTNVYAGVVTNYPGAPYAHYSYALAPEGAYRADLDPSGIDNTRLTRMSYAEGQSAQLVNSRIFTDTVLSNRSVIVFSSRTNAGQTATGDATKEYVTVRVMQAVLTNNTDSAVVGQKIDPASDSAGLGSGEVTIDSGNYNANIYNTAGDVGQWGPIYPVNRNFTDKLQLTVGWYYNPNVVTNSEPVAYIPAISTTYTNITYPDPADSDVIYIASQMGSEGVGQSISTNETPNYQDIFNPSFFANPAIYNQPVKEDIGYNPNEEHAFIAPSIAYTLTGDPRFNPSRSAAFALQNGLNTTNHASEDYTSDPFVLVQYSVPGATNASDASAMRIYAVKTVRTNASAQRFPDLDLTTHTAFDSAGQPVPQPANPAYDFLYNAIAGNPVIPPYPLNLAIGNVVIPDVIGGNIGTTRALWEDRTGNRWVVAGNGRFFQRYWYPMRPDFWLGEEPVSPGTTLAWVPDGVSQGDVDAFLDASTLAVASKYETYWGDRYPVLKKGETLTYAGGEYKADHPSSAGLPAVVNMASAEVVFDSKTPSMIMNFQTNFTPYAARWFKFEFEEVKRAEDTWKGKTFPFVELGEISFYRNGVRLTNEITATNTGGDNPANQGPAALVDGDPTTVWLDRNGAPSTNGTPSTVELDFGVPVSFDSYTFTTGADPGYTGRDPRKWIVSASTNRTDWVNVGFENANDLPEERSVESDWFGVNRNLFWDAPFTDASARIIRPLDRLATELAQAEMPDELQPSHPDKVEVSGSRWYFKDLGGSIGKRFYYDSLAGELVFRGRLNDLESGEPDLTRQPVQPYVLEPNFLTEETKELLIGLDSTYSHHWEEAIDELYEAATTEFTTGTEFGLGVVPATSRTDIVDIPFYDVVDLVTPATNGIGNVVPLSSLGIGSALVATPHFLEEDIDVPVYVTLAENNHPQASGAVALHIIKLAQDRYRGSINVITPRDAFDDRIELKHTGDFGGNTAEIYYQWYVRDVSPLAEAGTPDGAYSDNWQVYAQGLGLNSIVFEGRPDITLADKFFFVRYGGLEELSEANEENVVTNGLVSDSSWRNVLPDDPEPEWGFAPLYEVPFQWAGAANSPQLQADGSKRYLPQLVMGWVKRVLDAINLYEARYSATFTGDAPATYASMLQQAGGPYIGPVALNSDKDNIENTGLIALYETVLQRALDLTSTPGSSNMGTDQALLLAATRLSFLYQLLGSEAFSDAQNFVVPQSADASTPLPTDAFAFKNMVANPLQEELALLRGTDFLKSYPAFNRLFWNYVKADGEAYYNANYNIHDMDNNGLIDEADAAILYPMGHGDAWGHYLSATKMHYALLKRPGFQWGARSELYSLLQNVLPVDYLDEKTFATIAGDKVRAGAAILKSTYRDAYVSDPSGQWQGYEDTAQPARAWGVSEWSRRVGQGAWFDWLAVNAVTPAPSTNQLEGLDRIDRNTTAAEIGSVAAGLAEMQQLVNHANRGLNPLGLDSDAMAFQADPFYNGISWVSHPPFKQALDKALKAIETARGFYESASQADQQLRRIANDTRALQEQAILQDLEYRNRLIGLYGTPYEGTIGPGKIYAEGYNGPDLLTYMYVKYSSYNDIAPTNATFLYESLVSDINNQANPMDFQVGIQQAWTFEPESMSNVLANFYLDGSSSDGLILAKPGEDVNPDDVNVIYTRLPYETTSDYAFQAPHEWGRRASPGAIQDAIDEMLAAEIELELGIVEQNVYLNKVKMLAYSTLLKLESVQQSYNIAEAYAVTKLSLEATKIVFAKFIAHGSDQRAINPRLVVPRIELTKEVAQGEAAQQALPKTIGTFNGLDVYSAVKSALIDAKKVEAVYSDAQLEVLEYFSLANEYSLTTAEVLKEAGGEAISAYNEYVASLHELGEAINDVWTGQNGPLAGKIRELEAKGERVRAIVAEAERLVQERAALNMQIAAKAQRNRYADLVTRLNRNAKMRNYDMALDNAARYAWLAVKAYDYETSLSDGHPANAQGLLDQIVKTRSLGSVSGSDLVGILTRLSANYDALEGQIGLNNGQSEANVLSLRSEMMRISPAAESDDRWRDALNAALVPDLWQVPEFAEYCRPFASPSNGPQPGLVLSFSTEIASGKNFFGQPLSGLDHAFSPASYATKILSFTAAFVGYDEDGTGSNQQLSISPRFYLVPAGLDVQYCSDTLYPTPRSWSVVSQRIPVPYAFNTADLSNLNYQPTMNGSDGSYAERIRFGDSRAFITDNGLTGADDMWLPPLTSGWNSSSRLYGRSVWNTRWLLVIPGATLNVDQDAGLKRFVDTVTDIKLYLETYSNQGM